MFGRIRGWQRRHWRERSKAERVELTGVIAWRATVWAFSLSWLALPLAEGLHHRPLPLTFGGLLLVVSGLQCLVANRLTRPALDHYLDRAVLPARALGTAVALLALALTLLLALTAIGGLASFAAPMALGATLPPFGLVYGLVTPVPVFLRRSAALAVMLMTTVGLVRGTVGDVLVTGVVVAFMVGLSLLTSRCCAWNLSVLWEAERAREVEARLAVAEERLRFGRDLHDVLGRNLAVIALKAELAVQLGRRGRPEAVEQMIEVQRLAQESQREVRAVVRGYREADLDAELAGAQGVLAAAGIDCTLTGSATGLPSPVQSALGWVVREAATNVLRHGDARLCTVSLNVTDGRAELSVENDGAGELTATTGDQPGSGLTGLRERLRELDGTLRAGPAAHGRFRLTAEVPLPSPDTPPRATRRPTEPASLNKVTS